MVTDYKRFISYMYAYKNGDKKSNIGYAKIESKNNNCKFIINVKNNILKDKKWKVQLFYRGEEKDNREIYPINVAEVQIDNEEYSNVFVTETNNIFGSNKSLQKIVGIIMIDNHNNYIGTEWDDNGIDYLEVKKYAELESIETKVEETENNTEEENIIDKKELEKNSEDLAAEFKVEDSKKEIGNVVIEDIEHIEVDKKIKTQIDEPKPFIKRIFNGFPGMYPFEDDEIVECVKLEPHDLGVFPMDKWALANNSFLLHGYYTYRHLIFARLKQNGRYKYILGVPGIFRDRERFMARMFGFNNFKGVRNKALNTGEFGYWYMYFNL